VDNAIEDGNKYVVFTVEDSGIGIKKESFAGLFDEFEQFDSQKNHNISGTGLGLPIAKRLAGLMGGEIRFKSEYGKGSVFSFYLPFIAGDIDKVKSQVEIELVIANPDTKVLVVDDSAGNITVAVGLLAKHNIVPDIASSGMQAIEMITTNKYDLVFMDHMMPEMDGIVTTVHIREKGVNDPYYKNLPIVALTANAVSGMKEKFLENGFVDFLSKPIEVRNLNAILDKWIPNEKKMKSSEIEQFIYEENNDDTDEDIVIDIKGLNVKKGIMMVGGTAKDYLNALSVFHSDCSEKMKEMCISLEDRNLSTYTICVHALKSSLLIMGSKKLSEDAKMLESAGKANNIHYINTHNTAFVNSLEEILNNIHKVIVEKAGKKQTTSMSVESILDELQKLKTALDIVYIISFSS
jgi:CheY-like chemotaxis protein/HPt (histidine-containing phosphotransfer) domain-containing protein